MGRRPQLVPRPGDQGRGRLRAHHVHGGAATGDREPENFVVTRFQHSILTPTPEAVQLPCDTTRRFRLAPAPRPDRSAPLRPPPRAPQAGDPAQRLVRSDPRAVRGLQPAFAAYWKAKTGQDVTDQPVARRLGQAGPRGDRRARGRRGDAGAGLRHRRDRREGRARCRPTGRRGCPTTARPTPRPSCSWCARATRRASRTGATWSSPASR